ncbi:MAG: hypothetical protein COB08_007375 [Rhodobacteraceae bacterium]|nr:hypothetical protein [Paracoccaceae bacterium]
MTGQIKSTTYSVTNPGDAPFILTLKGRNKWALEELTKAGAQGCTPIKQPAPRWSAYIHNLRSFGVKVQTVTEHHGGAFAGNHGRYILLAEAVVVLSGGM